MTRRPCIVHGCQEYTEGSRCATHETSRWDAGFTGRRGSRSGWRKLRARVLREQGHRCSSCGITAEQLPDDESLECHHIDGDATNDRRKNLTGLCPTCHKEADAEIRRRRQAKSPHK